MIARLNGTVAAVNQDTILVNVGDLGYEVLVPAVDIVPLQRRVGQRVSLLTIEYIEGNAAFGQLTPRLLGFLREQDRDFFELFITVKGIGPRRALRALTAPVEQVAAAIVRADGRFLSTLPEIGKRTAERIITELTGRVDAFAGPAGSGGPARLERSEEQCQAIAALTALGERQAEAENWVDRACRVDPTLKRSSDIVKAAYRLKSVP
jgi:Holliday junction DNA helicase RuvA